MWVGPLVCEAQELSGGDGRQGDWWVANAWYRAVLRHPVGARTVPGVGGGTLVDAAPWGTSDGLHEVIPLVDGGWLDVEELAADGDRIRVSGTVVSLPDQPAEAEGGWREVAWVPDPDGPWLHLEGADGLWIHASGDHELLDGNLVSDEVVLGPQGGSLVDLGGALRVPGATTLLIASTTSAWEWLDPAGIALSGIAPGAEEVVLSSAGERIGRLPVDEDDRFDTVVPSWVDRVRAVASGRAPSPSLPPGQDLALQLGGAGAIDISLAWERGPTRPVRVEWSDARARSGVEVLPPSGGELALGDGTYHLELSAGPAVVRRSARVEVLPDQRASLGGTMVWAFDPGDRVLASLEWPGDRSRTWRGSDALALEQAVGAGLGFAVLSPEDDAANGDAAPEHQAHIRWRNGSLLTGDGGWSVVSWPWTGSSRRSGHGAPPPQGLAAEHALSLAWGGPSTSRFTAVDLDWLDAVDLPPWEVHPHPDLVRLDHPGSAPAESWATWLEWLDAWGDLVPVGPLVWVEVADRYAVGEVEVEDGLVRGRVVATTGPLIRLEVAGLGPGEVLPSPPRVEGGGWPVDLEVHGEVDRVALLGSGGRVLDAWTLDQTPWRAQTTVAPTRWAVAVAWSDDDHHWCATGPVWLAQP